MVNILTMYVLSLVLLLMLLLLLLLLPPQPAVTFLGRAAASRAAPAHPSEFHHLRILPL
jgi:hypothetical protein